MDTENADEVAGEFSIECSPEEESPKNKKKETISMKEKKEDLINFIQKISHEKANKKSGKFLNGEKKAVLKEKFCGRKDGLSMRIVLFKTVNIFSVNTNSLIEYIQVRRFIFKTAISY